MAFIRRVWPVHGIWYKKYFQKKVANITIYTLKSSRLWIICEFRHCILIYYYINWRHIVLKELLRHSQRKNYKNAYNAIYTRTKTLYLFPSPKTSRLVTETKRIPQKTSTQSPNFQQTTYFVRGTVKGTQKAF